MRPWDPKVKGRWKNMPAAAVLAPRALRPLGMLATDPLTGEFPAKQAHLKRQQDALFSGHRPQNFEQE